MLEYNLDIEKRSVWILATQSAQARAMPFFLTEIGKFYAGGDYYTKRSGKSGYYLVFTHSGRGVMHLGGSDIDLLPGDAMLISCSEAHDYRTAGQGWVHSWVHMDGSGVEAFYALLENVPVAISNAREFSRQLAALAALANHIDMLAEVRISHGISALLTEMVSDKTHHTAGRSGANTAVDNALRYIEERYHQPISIDDIAQSVNLSKYHFVRMFSQQVGTTPYNYLIRYRVNQSKRLLCATDSPVSEIALLAGYASESNYIHQFSKVTGMTPARFRKTNINYIDTGSAI